MEENKEFELELSDETLQKVEDYAKKTGSTTDQVIEYVLFEFMEKQIKVIEKRAAEVKLPVNDLINQQFVKILDYLSLQNKQ